MKTSEFIKRVEGLGYQTNACEFWIDVIDRFGLKGTVFTKDFKLALSTNDVKLIKICVEYTETQISERKEEKKYTVVLPDPTNSCDVKYMLTKVNGQATIMKAHKSHLEWLTEAEIKRNHEYLWQFAKEVKE